MKRIASILLICLIALVAGMLPVTPIFRELARELMHQRIHRANGFSEKQVVLVADDAVKEWEQAGKEFRKDGLLYDVVGSCLQDRHQYYRCLVDDTELNAERTADNAQKAALAPHPQSAHDRLSKALADWLSALFLHTQKPLQFQSCSTQQQYLAGTAHKHWLKPLLSADSPPPKAA